MRRLLLLLLAIGCAVTGKNESEFIGAVRSGDVADVRALCAHGADPNAPFGPNGWTPLLHAVHKHQLGTAAALIDAGAMIDRAAPGGMTPLVMAAGYGHRDMVALLLQRGATPRITNPKGEAAIDYALTGMTDSDAFTFFRCQNDTAALLKASSPPPRPSSARWASLKGCA
jgi:ankyrin repeat protein